MTALLRVLATMGPVGYAPIAPATAASAVVALIGWFLPVPPLPLALMMITLAAPIAAWLCGEAEKSLGHDAHPIVADEVIGQSIALVLVPHHWAAFFASFLLFRIFDVWKPLGAYQAQSLPGGIGVLMDDVIAGITACLVFHGSVWAVRLAGVTLPF